MRRVFKHPLQVTDVQYVGTRAGWKPLSVQVQNGVVCLWAEVDDRAPEARYRVFVHGTGHEVHPAATTFVGTFQLPSLGLVFHVYTEEASDEQ